jgi:UDP-N-acetylmuramoyl-tripeptide--D-alanyl-D-alanine ligase
MIAEPWGVELATVAEVLHAPVIGAAPSRPLVRVSTDSRDIQEGDLFVALVGERVDGHDFIGEARQKGAIAALVERPVEGLPYVQVGSCVEALGALAQWWRGECPTPLVAITGSNGKTSVKELTAQILRTYVGEAGEVLATQGNFNNHLGLPLTLLRLRRSHRFAVVEMGMNHAGELSVLTRIARPQVALLNNVQRAHIGMFRSIDEVALAKAEIFEGLSADGIAIINQDDPFRAVAEQKAGAHKVLRFSLGEAADMGPVIASVPVNNAFPPAQQLVISVGSRALACHLPLMGMHNAANALAAMTAAWALGVPPEFSCRALESFKGVPGRLMALQGVSGVRLIDDTYNANPDSVIAAIEVLARQPGRRILVLGDLGELGEGAPLMHREVGEAARKAGLDGLFGLGVLVGEAVSAFGPGARSTEELSELCDWMKPLLGPELTVLIKGSRFMKMERVVKELSTCC